MKILKRLLITSIMLFTIIALIKPMNKVKAETTGNNGLEFTLNSDGKSYSVSKGTCIEENIVIPSEYEGLPVTMISDNAFSYCANLKSIEIPANIINIGSHAFYSCYDLKEITILGNIDAIKSYMFYNCSSLENIVIPNTIKSIGNSAFYACENLSNIYYDGTIENWCNIEFSNYVDSPMHYGEHFYMKDSNNEYYEVTELVIPDTVTSIGNYQFFGFENLTKVTIPNSITNIGTSAFVNCNIYKIINNSDIVLNIGNITNGSIAVNAYLIVDKEGSEIYRNGHIVENNFVFNKTGEEYTLVAYIGTENTVTLPLTINGIKYTISEMKGVKEVIIPEGFTEITTNAFRGCNTLTNISIPNSVTSIGSYAFTGCSNLKDINLPDSITTIGDYAFSNCDNLEKIEIPYGVETISQYLFYYCTNLTDVKLPNSIVNIYGRAFANCTNLKTITIPNSVKEFSVYIFEYCTNLEEVIFEDNIEITAIGNDVFYDCKNLKNINIPEGVTNIGSYAFWGCVSLEKVVIPNTITSISSSAFVQCSSLEKIEIPNSITTIGSYAFKECTNLTIYFENDSNPTLANNWNSSRCPVVWDCCFHTNEDWIMDVTPTCTIDGYRYQNCTKCGETVGEVMPALGHNYDENNVCIVCGIEKTNEGLIVELNGSGTGYILKGIGEYIGSELNISNSHNGLPIYTISANAFENADNLTKITIPDSFTSIGENAFLNCSNLETIVLPATLKTIGKNAFYECEKLANVYYGGTIESWCNFSFSSNAANPMVYGANFFMLDSNNEYCEVKDIVIPNTIKKLGLAQFYGFENLETIYIPSSITTVSSFIFEGCKNLTIHCERDYQPSGWSSLWNSSECPVVWSYCEHISSDWIIDVNVTCINEGHRYQECTKCKRVLIEEVIEKEEHQFDELNQCQVCKEYKVHEELIFKLNNNKDGYILTSANGCSDSVINIPSIYNDLPVVEIYELAFNNLNTVERVLIPDTVTSINLYSFMGCTSLKEIVIPKSLTYISSSVFENCENLENVYYTGTIADWCNIVFEDTPMKYAENFYMLDRNNEYYEVTELVIPDTITSIGNYQFYGFGNIKKVTIPEGVTNIGHNAFTNCSNLISVDLPSTITNMGDFVFENCSNLKDIELPNTITSMGGGVFAYCESLEEITIPTGINKIYMMSFVGCTSLKNIVLPDNIYSIDLSAFSGCSGLTNVEISDSVEKIENSAFADCTSLTKIVIPLYVNKMGSYVFSGCENLTIYCRVKSKPIGWDANWNIENCPVIWSYGEHILGEWIIDVEPSCEENGHRYALCTKCNEVVGEETLDALGHDLVYYDKLDATCLEKGHEAYEKCQKCDYSTYKEISLSEHNYDQFNKCEVCREYKVHEDLTFKLNDTKDGYILTGLGSCGDTVINIPSIYNDLPVVEIGNNAFEYSSVTLINIPSSIVNIGDNVFYGSKFLEQVIVDIMNEYFTCIDGILFNKDMTELIVYPAKKNASEYIIPNTVINIKDSAFAYNEQLTKITIPESVTTITDYAFYRCILLTEINIPSNVESIGSNAFGECHNLEKITFEENSKITEIADWTFYNCKKLTIFVIPINVTSIGVSAFGNCSNLIEIIIPIKVVVIKNNAFTKCNNLTIKCEVETKPTGFENNWNAIGNGNSCETIWGYCEHINSEWIIDVEATCRNEGHKYQNCIKCEEILVEEVIAKLQHKLLKYEKLEPTCETIGYNAFESCENCDYTTYVELKALGHNYTSVVTKPTCLDKGYTTHTCERCNDSYIDSYVEALGHNYVDNVCTVCKDVLGIAGDLDGNEAVNTSDVIYLLMHTYFPDAYPVEQDCDYTGDGIVNTADVIHLLMHTYFPDAYPIEFKVKKKEEEIV